MVWMMVGSSKFSAQFLVMLIAIVMLPCTSGLLVGRAAENLRKKAVTAIAIIAEWAGFMMDVKCQKELKDAVTTEVRIGEQYPLGQV
jgi:hypothetical protein